MDKPHFRLLQTKLYRQNVPKDHVIRPQLLERLEKNRHMPMLLCSAPAGYGKSTLVSSWLDKCDRPNAWVSLDENDNDLRLFVSYFVAAVQTIFHDAGQNTLDLIKASNLLPIPVLAVTLINELDQIDQDFIVVLDDIHRITNKNIFEFLNTVMRHPPRCMQLIVIGRRDPMLPLALMRARGQVLEIRINELRFTPDESLQFLKTAMAQHYEKNFALILAQRTEGWITGLRLVVLALKGQSDAGQKIQELKGNTHYVMDYLISEVLLNLPDGIRLLLLKTAILKRFCEPLCDMLLENESSVNELSGYRFVSWIQKNNMFMISLDIENKWMRYHHLFGDLLKRNLIRTNGQSYVNAIYKKVSIWFEEQNLIDESIHYALSSGNPESAANIIERHRHAVLNRDEWFVIQNWLTLIPEKIIEQSPGLLLAKAWVLNHQFRLIEIPEVLKRVDSILERETGKPALVGELYFFKAFLLFWEGQVASSIEMSKKAQEQIPKEEMYDLIRGDNEIYYAMALQMNGKGEVAIRELKEKIGAHTKRKGMYFTRLISSHCFVHLLSGDLKQAETASLQLKNVSKKSGLSYADSWSDYMQACCHFHVYDLDKACHYFSVVSEHKYIMHALQSTNCLTGLAMTYQAMGRTEEAEATMDQLNEFAIEMNSPNLLVIARSARVRLSLIQGNLEPGIEWVRAFDEPLQMSSFFVWLELPHVTLCRVLIAIGSNDSLIQACERLEHLLEIADTTHNTFHKIDILVLKGLALHRLSRIHASQKVLEEAIKMAVPGGWVRPFVEVGPPIIDLLRKLHQQKTGIELIGDIFDAFKESTPLNVSKLSHAQIKKSSRRSAGGFKQLVDPLTNREMDVLELLCERLQNKEIAKKLFISPTTVKSHLKHLFQKLQVENRRQAVQKAIDLEILERH